MIDNSMPGDNGSKSRDHSTTNGADDHHNEAGTGKGLLDVALELIHELGIKAEKSNGSDEKFDPGLPFEPTYIRALAYVQRKDVAEYNRVWAKLKEARPAPDLTLLRDRIKSEVKVQDTNERRADSNSADFKLDSKYDTPSGLMANLKDYKINSSGGISKMEFESLYDKTTSDTTFIPVDKPICDFVAWPTREIMKDDGEANTRYIELEGVLPDFCTLPKITISMGEFSDMKWPGLSWGMRAAIRPSKEKELKYCLQKMSQSGIPESFIYTFLGWKKVDGKWIYLHAGGAIGAENVEIELPSKLQNYRLPNTVSDIRSAMDATLALFDIGPAKIMYPLIAMPFLSPLMEPFRQAGIEPGFLFYLWGETGSRKSTIIALVLNLFGNFNNKNLPASFRDTAKSIEEFAFVAKDILLSVEDLYPTQDPREQQKMNGVLDNLMRNQGDRHGGSRLIPGKSDYTLGGGHPPRGLAAASGELQALRGSALARACVRHICPNDLDNEKLTVAQEKRDLLGQAMVGYLKWLAPQIDELPAILSDRFEELRKNAREEAKVEGRHGRLDETVADMYIGLEMFFKYAVVSGAISQEEANIHLAKGWQALNQGADEQTEMAYKNDVSQDFIHAILELKSLNKVYFCLMNGAVPIWEQSIIPKQKELIGWGPDKDDVYYLLMDMALKSVNELRRGQGQNIVISKDVLLDALEQKGLLATPTGKSRSFGKTICNTTRWVTAVKSQAFNLEEEKPS